MPNNPRRLEVAWQNPSSWPDPESFPLKFFLRYRPLILDQWQHVSDAEQEAARWQRGDVLATSGQGLKHVYLLPRQHSPFSSPFPSSLPPSFKSHSAYKCALQALPSPHFNPWPVSIFHTYVLYKTCQRDVKGIQSINVTAFKCASATFRF